MTENCTIYCTKPCSSVIERVRQLFFDTQIVEEASSLTMRGRGGSLRISSKKFEHEGDEFSSLVLSSYFHFDQIKTAAHSAKAKLLAHIEDSKCILGIVADPAFDSDERFNQVVFSIAKLYNGVVFNGYEALDQDGILLLDNEGKSESEN
jgi:hypothetical protein